MMNPKFEGQDLRFEIVEVKRTQWNIISRGLKFFSGGWNINGMLQSSG